MEQKKYANKRIEQRIPLHFLIGLNVALLLTLAAFEWKTEEGQIIVPEYVSNDLDWDDPDIHIPQPPPPIPPAPVVKLEIVAVDDDVVIDEPVVTIDDNFDSPVVEIDYVAPPLDDEEVDVAIHDVVEVDAEFPGGWNAFYDFVGSRMKYPSQARRMGVEGKVYVQFVIEKDGSITDLKVAKGIGAGCEQETERVLELLPSFIPARNNGKPVRKRMVLPIYFKLQN